METTITAGEIAGLKAPDTTTAAERIEPQLKTKISRQTLFVLIMITFLTSMGLTFVWPILPFIVDKYVTNPADLSPAVGWLTSIYAICQFVAAPALGILSDRYGRRPVLLVCLFGSMIGYLIFGIGGALWVLILSRIIDGLTGGDSSVLAAYVSDVTEPEERAKYFGYFGAATGVGFVVGPVIGGVTASFGYTAPIYLSAAITALVLLLAFFYLPESLDKKYRKRDIQVAELNPFKQLKNLLYTSGLRLIILLGVLYAIPFAIIQFNIMLLAIDSLNFDPVNIGLLLLVTGPIAIVVQGFLIGRLLKAFGERKVLIFGFVLQFTAYALMAAVVFIASPVLLFAGIIVNAVGSCLIDPSITGLISRLVSPEKQGVVQGSNTGLRSLIAVIGPVIGGFMYGQLGHASPFLISCVVMLIAAGMVLVTIPALKAAVTKPSAPTGTGLETPA